MAQTKPIHEIRLGNIRATIWPNQSEDQTWYAVTFSRRYKQGKEFKDASSFNRDDLPVLAQAAQMAFGWIWINQAVETATSESK